MVTLASDHVEGAERGDDVGDHEAGDETAQGLRDGKARRPDTNAVRRAAAVGDEVKAELAVATLGVAVGFAGGDLDALHDDLEVLNRTLDRRIDLVLGGQYDARIVHVDGAVVGHLVESLLDDARALA